jgi:serine/threonine-protein kinase haspin
LALAVAEKAFEFEHRDLHWGNVLISRTKDKYVYYNLDGKEIKITSKGVKVCAFNINCCYNIDQFFLYFIDI